MLGDAKRILRCSSKTCNEKVLNPRRNKQWHSDSYDLKLLVMCTVNSQAPLCNHHCVLCNHSHAILVSGTFYSSRTF